TSDAREIHGSFGLAGTDEHAAGARAKREGVAWAREILRLGLGVDGGENGDGAVGGANAGGHADAGVDGFGERGTMDGSIDGRHEGKVQLVAAILGERRAEERRVGKECGSGRGVEHVEKNEGAR